MLLTSYPTDPFTAFEAQNLGSSEFYVVQNIRSTDLQALKLRNGQSGTLGEGPSEIEYKDQATQLGQLDVLSQP